MEATTNSTEDELFEREELTIADIELLGYGFSTKHFHSPPPATANYEVDPIINPGGIFVRMMRKNYHKIIGSTISFIEHAISSLFTLQLPPVTSRQRLISKIPDSVAADVLTIFRELRVENTTEKRSRDEEAQKCLRFMHVFLVPKGHPATEDAITPARIIGNPRQLNEARKERPITLIPLSVLLRLAARCQPGLFAIEIDFKNFFPQIPLGNNVAIHMAVYYDDRTFVPLTLTQGWNASTFIAQSISWGAVAFKLNDDDHLGLSVDWTAASPPPFALLHDRQGNFIGFIAIVYDNVLVVTTTPSLRNAWHTRLLRNFTRYNVVTKYTNVTEGHFDYCGISVDARSGELQWRTEEDRFTLWKKREFTVRSPANIQAMLQYIFRQHQLRQGTLVEVGPYLKIASNVGKAMVGASKREWHAPHACAEHTFKEVSDGFSKLQNPWCKFQARRIRRPMIIATDATKLHIGWTIIEQGKILTKWHEEIPYSNIDYAETIAVQRAAEVICEANHFQTILKESDWKILLVDNQVSSRNFARGFASDQASDNAINLAYRILGRSTCLWVDCPSESNIADGLTRDDKDLNTEDAKRRLKESMEIANLAIQYFEREASSNWFSRVHLLLPADMESKEDK